MDWEEWEAKLMPRDQCGRCRRRLLVEAFTKDEFQRKERPAFCKECTAEMKSRDEKLCKTCDTWATNAQSDESARGGGDAGVAGIGDGDDAKQIRTMYCVKCSDVKRQKNSRRSNAKWAESVGKVRCSNDGCLSLFPEEAEMSEAQKKHKEAGERLCRRCAEERDRTTRESNNKTRKVEAEAKPMTCAACGGAFSDREHLKQHQEQIIDGRKKPKWCAEAARKSGSQPAVARLISAAARARADYRSRRSPTLPMSRATQRRAL